MTEFLCKLGLHKWREHGKRVLVVWKEPGLLPGTKVQKRKHVSSERECLRCRIKERRKFSENIEGFYTISGIERVKDEE
ncbi:hypothetical protein KAH85_03080 [Candidatus Bathyarchaeota archaeon]|nr:hypothetical protein [Candidatus Bathyarchaeota archaeon]MCK5631520.1 hypothetical protein [Candidatus Bathyarchaeota archaeon]